MVLCECGYQERYDDTNWSCSEKGLLNHISFPPFDLLPSTFEHYEEEVCDITDRWCLIGEIVRDISLTRHAVLLETRFSETISVSTYSLGVFV